MAVKGNLEGMRRYLVSPLVRTNGSSIGIEAQIKGLEEVSLYLGAVRDVQKARRLEFLFGDKEKRETIGGVDDVWGNDY